MLFVVNDDCKEKDLWYEGQLYIIMGIDDATDAVARLDLAAGRSGLFIIDVQEPTAPTLVQHYPVEGTAHDVTIVEHYALIAAGEAGLQVLDIRDPAQPVVVATFATPACAHVVVSSGGRIYLLDQWGGFYMLTLTPPSMAGG